MKYILIVLATGIITPSDAQDFFPGKNVDLFVGHSFIAAPKDPRLQENGYRNFSTNLDEHPPMLWDPMPYNVLQGDTFLCTGLNPWEGKFGDEHRILDLQNRSGKKLFYFYDPRYSSELNLIPVGEITPVSGYYCRDVRKTVDRFDDTETWATEQPQPLVYWKRIMNSDTVYYLFLTTTAELPNTGSDAVLILKSGKRLTKTCTMAMTVTDKGDYQAKSTCRLQQDDVDLFISDPISEFRIFLYEQRVDDPEHFSDMLNCIRLNKLR